MIWFSDLFAGQERDIESFNADEKEGTIEIPGAIKSFPFADKNEETEVGHDVMDRFNGLIPGPEIQPDTNGLVPGQEIHNESILPGNMVRVKEEPEDMDFKTESLGEFEEDFKEEGHQGIQQEDLQAHVQQDFQQRIQQDFRPQGQQDALLDFQQDYKGKNETNQSSVEQNTLEFDGLTRDKVYSDSDKISKQKKRKSAAKSEPNGSDQKQSRKVPKETKSSR